MLAEKYAKLFLEINDTKDNGGIVKNIIKTEEITGTDFLKWNNEQIELFLKEFHSVSPVSLRKNMTILKKFANLVCDKEELKRVEYPVLTDEILMDLIDKKGILSVTLSYQQFQYMRRQLKDTLPGETISYRDVVIFELAWYGLTEDEIRRLKKSDVEFTTSKDGMEVAILSLVTNKVVRIEDLETIEDLKEAMSESYRITMSNHGKLDRREYKDSDYIIRPIKSGVVSNKDYLDKPTTALKGAFARKNITCEGVDIPALSLDDIRRSRLILLLAPQNEKFFDFETVAGLYNIKSVDGIRWHKDISILKYESGNK